MNRVTRDSKIVAIPEYTFVEEGKDKPIKCEATTNTSSLPQDIENLAVEIGWSTYTGLRLSSPNQSDSVMYADKVDDRELMSIRSAVVSIDDDELEWETYSPVGIPLLLTYFESHHIDDLVKHDHRIFFEATLFASQRLPRALKESLNCPNDLKQFFDLAILHFEGKLRIPAEKTSAVETLTFMCTQWQRTLVYMQKAHINEIEGQNVADLLEKVRNKIKKLQKDPAFKSNEAQQHLHLALIDSYHAEGAEAKKLVRDIISSLAAYNKEVQGYQPSKKLTPAFVSSALSTPIKKKQVIQQTIEENYTFASDLFNEIAKSYRYELPAQARWVEGAFPIYYHTTSTVIYSKSMYFLDASPSMIAYP